MVEGRAIAQSGRPKVFVTTGTVEEVAKLIQREIDKDGRWAYRILATTQSHDGQYLRIIALRDEGLL